MARLSDVIRKGESALEGKETGHQSGEAARPEGDPTGQEGGAFSSLPAAQQSADKMKDFPILSRIYSEVGTVATVVDKIDEISAFIRSFSSGEAPPAPTPQAPGAGSSPQAPSPQPGPADPHPAIESTPDEISEEEIEALYDQLRTIVEGVMQAARTDEAFSVDQAFTIIARAVDTAGATDVLYRKAIYTRESEDVHAFASAVVVHSVNVAIYAIKIGEGLDYNRDQLVDLGVAALLHDVGMVSLPADFFEKQQLTRQDIEILHQHPFKGREIMSRLGDSFNWLADIVLHEHEREDGSGYPEG